MTYAKIKRASRGCRTSVSHAGAGAAQPVLLMGPATACTAAALFWGNRRRRVHSWLMAASAGGRRLQ